jgi:hypothetical protein
MFYDDFNDQTFLVDENQFFTNTTNYELAQFTDNVQIDPACKNTVTICVDNTPKDRCQGCNNNLSANNPASQYQRQKIIQKTVRVPSSLYTMNLAALNVYEKPSNIYTNISVNGTTLIVPPGANWNQMSDRRNPHIQHVKTGLSNSTRRTITRMRPGALSPGGAGVDIKHNSYERHLNRLKGKGPVRRGPIPENFGTPHIPFNCAYPIYGGKTVKTSIVSKCSCDDNIRDGLIYRNSNMQELIESVQYTFKVGDTVLVYISHSEKYNAIILELNGEMAIVQNTETNDVSTVSRKQLHLCRIYTCAPNLVDPYTQDFDMPVNNF